MTSSLRAPSELPVSSQIARNSNPYNIVLEIRTHEQTDGSDIHLGSLSDTCIHTHGTIYAEPQHKLLFRVVRGGGGDF